METARPLSRSTVHGQSGRGTWTLFLRVVYLWGVGFLFFTASCNPKLESTTPIIETTPLPAIPTTPREPGITPSATLIPTGTASPSATAPSPEISPTAPPPFSCLEKGKITQHTLTMPLHPDPWPFRVYTPPCYEQTTTHYPVIILIHGSSFQDDQWDRIGVDETADSLIQRGEIPPFLILMPFDWYWTYEPFSDPFGEALVESLIPWMDQNYRTLPEREYRAIGGLSRGASWAVHLGLKHWELFSAVGAHSLPVFPSDPVFLEDWLKEIPNASVPRFFLDIGEEDNLLEKALWFENLINAYNVPHEWHLFPGTHDEAYWSSHLEQYLRWYTQTWSHLQ